MNSKSSEDMAPLFAKTKASFKQAPILGPEDPYSTPFRTTFVGNAMRRDLSPPLPSYFQGRLNRALLLSLLMRRTSNSLQNRRLNSARRFRTPENGRPKRPSA